MTIEWGSFQNELGALIDQAGNRTDEKLAGRISSICRLTDDEVKQLFPDPGDVKRLAELMEIVKCSGDENEKINRLVSSAENFGGIIFKLLNKFA